MITLTVIAPGLAEAVGQLHDCLGLEVPFGSRMITWAGTIAGSHAAVGLSGDGRP